MPETTRWHRLVPAAERPNAVCGNISTYESERTLRFLAVCCYTAGHHAAPATTGAHTRSRGAMASGVVAGDTGRFGDWHGRHSLQPVTSRSRSKPSRPTHRRLLLPRGRGRGDAMQMADMATMTPAKAWKALSAR